MNRHINHLKATIKHGIDTGQRTWVELLLATVQFYDGKSVPHRCYFIYQASGWQQINIFASIMPHVFDLNKACHF